MSPRERVLKSLRKTLRVLQKQMKQIEKGERGVRVLARSIATKKLSAQKGLLEVTNKIAVINAPARRWPGDVRILSPEARDIIDREMRKKR